VEDFLAWLSSGPPSASVAGVAVTALPPTGATGFAVS